MAIRTLRTQLLICGVVLVAMAQQARAASFQVTGVTPPAAYSCPSALGCTTTVTVQGQGFSAALTGCTSICPSGPDVRFGGTSGVITNITDTQITVILPVHAPGTVDVMVFGLAPGNSSTLPGGFTFLDPASIASFRVTGVTPPASYRCPSVQGCTTAVTVQGQGFNHALTGCTFSPCIGPYVLFGGKYGVITEITDTQITVILPEHSPGAVDVTVIGLFWRETSNLPAGFTFLDPAAIPLFDGRTVMLLALSIALIGLIVSAIPVAHS
jgi:large repetitive protein